MRTHFDNELARIHGAIQLLGAQVNRATARAVAALIERHYEEARAVKQDDRSTDRMRYDLENTCLTLMATQQPVARDLRELAAVTLVAVELERCGDYAKGVAKAARRIMKANSDIPPYNLAEMDVFARGMLERTVTAFLNGDVAVAQQVAADDAHMDQLYDALLAQVVADLAVNGSRTEGGMWLLHAGHCLERFADRAANIAGHAMFVQTGEFLEGRSVSNRPGASEPRRV
jgi:phosphate transport system protein